ncbi:MAG TPA: hypothetical protein VMW52_11035 [Phycisphaerae bacterium]|nr:hypothetical protein [Phycisphaerae bacterium]
MTNDKCSMPERCRKRDLDDGTTGCIKPARHMGRCTVREDRQGLFDQAFGGKPKLGAALKARKRQFIKAADEVASDLAADGADDRIAALCEIATALGMVRVELGGATAWVNPRTGVAAMLDGDAGGLWRAGICVDEGGAAIDPTASNMMNILGVPGLVLPDGGILYVCGGRMIVQTPSGGLRPATLNVEPALGPAGDGEGR